MSKYRPSAGESTTQAAQPAPFVASDSENFGFFPSQVIDNLMHVVIAQGAEHWAVRRRMFVLEKILEESGVLLPGVLERYEPSDADADAWEAERDIYIKRAFGALARVGQAKPTPAR